MEQGARASKDKGKSRLEILVPQCQRCESQDLVCKILVGGKLTSCEECKGMRCCERPGEEKALKQKQKVVEEQDWPWKKQRMCQSWARSSHGECQIEQSCSEGL